MALILLIESSTKLCSVGLARDGEIVAIRENDSQQHAELTNSFVEEVCNETGVELRDLDAVSVGGGPGSYTGLRIGVSVAKGICYAIDRPLIAIPSLLTVANGILQNSDPVDARIVPMIDARRNEVYAAVFDAELNEQKSMNSVILDEVGYASLGDTKLIVGGDGAEKVVNKDVELVRGVSTSVRWMASLADQAYKDEQYVDVAYYAPLYGKAANAIKPKPLFTAQR